MLDRHVHFYVKTCNHIILNKTLQFISVFLDVSKAFDRVNHWKFLISLLLKKLLKKYFVIDCEDVYFCHFKQEMFIKLGKSTSRFFTVSNSVELSGILSLRLFAVYVDDLSTHLHDAKWRYFIGHQCINHVMYADDICHLAPSAIELQKLLEICYGFVKKNRQYF